MPTYQYACTAAECGNRFELVQAFTDPAATECPVCGRAVRKVYGSVGVVFKGSGFYRTDSRNESRAASSDSKSDAKSADGEKKKTDAKPAKTDTATSTAPSSTNGSGKGSTSGSATAGKAASPA